MLSKSRIVALLALILGVALVVAGILLPRMIADERPVPLELSSRTLSLVDPDATVGPNYQGVDDDKPIQAPVARQFSISLNQPADDKEASAHVGVSTYRQDIDDDLQALLDAQVFSYRVDRTTGAAVGGAAKVSDTPVVPSTDVPMEGYWAKLPARTQQQTYDFFDVTLRTALPAEFNREETRTSATGESIPVYVFRQEIEPTSVRASYQGIRNEITDKESGEPAQLFHSGWREITVEPQSGLIVGVEENIHDAYRTGTTPDNGKEVETLLDFHGKTGESEEQQMLAQAQSIGEQRNVGLWRTVLIGAGVIVSVFALAVALSPGRRRA